MNYVWVFKRPDSLETAQLPAPPPEIANEKMWWSVIVVLLQFYRAI